MGRYVITRLGYSLVTFLVIATLTFFLMQLLPGSPYNNKERLTETQIEQLNERYGLDDPVPVQYVNYMTNLVKGDLGLSFQFPGRSVNDIIGDRIAPSAQLGFQAILFGSLVGLILGIVAAIKHNTFWDYGAMILAVLGISIPSFVFAGLLQYFVGVQLRWLPIAFWGGFEYSILPTLALSVFVIATVARFMRTEMLEVLGQDYIVTAKAKGITQFNVVVKHTIRNAIIPVITVIGPLVVSLLTGTLVIEQIFGIPGLGQQFVNSIVVNDYPVIMGLAMLYSALFISVIFVIDILYGIIDPRIRLAGGKK